MDALPTTRIDTRPWGQFEQFTLNESSTVKILTVHAGEAFSLQTHAHRDEFWRILSGAGIVTVGDTKTAVTGGESFYIPKGSQHRAHATHALQILEIALGAFDEHDINRLADNYGRS